MEPKPPIKIEEWFFENHQDRYGQGYKVKRMLESLQTPYQKIEIYETYSAGNLLVLDGCIMLTSAHEFTYHEMLAHPPLLIHPNPKSVLIIGGGDGGLMREVLKHKSVSRAVMCEIDKEVTELSKKHFPELTQWIGKDKRAEILFEDGVKFIKAHKNSFDVILIDSTDPVGAAEGLFTSDFYAAAKSALKQQGIIASQAESYWYMKQTVAKILTQIKAVFENVNYYSAQVPCYPGTVWGFTIASSYKYDFTRADDFDRAAAIAKKCQYYTPQIHKASFFHPKFAEELIASALK
ncbi:MAG: spermidine synthase [Myxococcota bacterium]